MLQNQGPPGAPQGLPNNAGQQAAQAPQIAAAELPGQDGVDDKPTNQKELNTLKKSTMDEIDEALSSIEKGPTSLVGAR